MSNDTSPIPLWSKVRLKGYAKYIGLSGLVKGIEEMRPGVYLYEVTTKAEASGRIATHKLFSDEIELWK